jgi:hypothetical protein
VRSSAGTLATRGGRTKVECFTKATAEVVGVSESTIQNSVRRGETLGKATLTKIAGTSLDNGTELDALTRLPEPERAALIDRAAAGEDVSAKPQTKPPPTAAVPETT